MIELLPLLLQGTWVTVKVTAFGSLLAIACALIAALARLSPLAPLRWLAVIYVEVFRGSSLLVQLFWLYFVLPLPPFNVEMSAFAVAVVGLGLNIGAYGAEVLRGAIRSVHRGQHEACHALNMTPLTRMRRIILPQALPLMLPTFGNNAIELLKATSVVSLISLADMTFQAQVVRSQTGNTLLPFVTILVLYFAMSSVLSFAIRSYERRVTRGLDGVR